MGRADRHRLPGHLLLPQAGGRAGPLLGRRARRDQKHLRQAGDPRGGEEVSRRREGPVRERSGLRLVEGGPRQAGRDLHRHGFGAAGVSRPDAAILQHHYSADRQQVCGVEFGGLVRRIVRLRAAGGEDRIPLAGLLPHQLRQDGPVRADADHRRRRGPGALRRRLHGPHVQQREPARRRGRGDRQARARGSATPPSRTGPTTSTTW